MMKTKPKLLECVTVIVLFCNSLSVLIEGSELLQFNKENDNSDDWKNVKASFTLGLPQDPMKKQPHDSNIDVSQISQQSKENGKKLDYNFIHAFIASISVIIVSEIGDKTFFIAAIMAMKHARITVFAGAMFALGLMTILSVFLGFATTVIPRKYTFYISTILFAIFGLKMLKEGYEMDPNEGKEELEEVQAEIKKKEEELESKETTQDIETGFIRSKLRRSRIFRICSRICSPIFIQAFTMTFLAEWGDRSQLTTIILGSRENPYGVTLGGIIGHSLCTGLAVLGGRFVAQKISVRTVTVIGGIVFLTFAVSALFIGDYDANSY